MSLSDRRHTDGHRRSLAASLLVTTVTVTTLALDVGCTRRPRATVRYDLARSQAIATIVSERTALDLGAPDSRPYLRRGWYWNERSQAGSFVWSRGLASTIELPLNSRIDRKLRLRVSPHRPAGAPPLTLSVEVNGRRSGVVVLNGGPAELWIEAPAELWRIGDNLLEFHYSYSRYTLPSDGTSALQGRDVAVAWDSLLLTGRGESATPDASVRLEPSRRDLRLPCRSRLDFSLDLEPGSALSIGHLELPPGCELIVQLRPTDAGSSRELARLGRSGQVTVDFGLDELRAARLSLITTAEEASRWVVLRRPQIVVADYPARRSERRAASTPSSACCSSSALSDSSP